MNTSGTKHLTFTFYMGCFAFYMFISSCSVQKQISRSARQVIADSSLQTAHVGISIYEPATGKYWYNYNGDKYFVPASNTKIPTCYAAMKYLGDSLVGLRYGYPEESGLKSKLVVIQPTGDPTFLLEEYKNQPVLDFLTQKLIGEKRNLGFMDTAWQEQRWGNGWSWNDYDASYMAERSSLPIYGNIVSISLNAVNNRLVGDTTFLHERQYRLFKTGITYFDSLVNSNMSRIGRRERYVTVPHVKIKRDISSNFFTGESTTEPFSDHVIPFVTNGAATALNILQKSFGTEVWYIDPIGKKNEFSCVGPSCDMGRVHISKWHILYSQPVDSLLKPMMHRSDNFFAEQVLLMVSNERLGRMSDRAIIDTLLKTDFNDLPQKPRWADGSGLSRYNLFTPQDLVSILAKMDRDFGMDRIKVILPTGGEGTLSNYYQADSSAIYAKTGTLSGVVALSGYLYTRKQKLLIFSVLVNNHQASATAVRRAVEKFLQGLRQRY